MICVWRFRITVFRRWIIIQDEEFLSRRQEVKDLFVGLIEDGLEDVRSRRAGSWVISEDSERRMDYPLVKVFWVDRTFNRFRDLGSATGLFTGRLRVQFLVGDYEADGFRSSRSLCNFLMDEFVGLVSSDLDKGRNGSVLLGGCVDYIVFDFEDVDNAQGQPLTGTVDLLVTYS